MPKILTRPTYHSLAPILAAIGRRVASRRGELGLSQVKLAARMDSSQMLVSKIETGHGNMRLSTLFKLAEALDVSPAALLDGAAQ